MMKFIVYVTIRSDKAHVYSFILSSTKGLLLYFILDYQSDNVYTLLIAYSIIVLLNIQ